MHGMANRLAASTSPYLLQHADNPVDWWEWCDEAFAEARARDVPVLLSVGYAACHWCHVMAHESFESPETAALMNEHFVCVKVDREERPDVDAVYMEATTAMTGHGGWPMTCFLTPAGEPFFCGTYFPPADRHGMPGFPRLLLSVAQAWRERRDDVTASAEEIVRQLAERSGGRATADLDAATLDAGARSLHESSDDVHGGFGGAPKFPPSMALEFLLRHADRTGNERSLAVVRHTCERMARGGMYDQLGGGFARYSVDATWTVPHFEKMLYDNALLLRLYARLWWRTRDPLARRVTEETAGWLLRDLLTPEGGLASALDADSEGEEGRFYVWTPDQLAEVLGADDGRWAADTMAVGPSGSFEHGTSVLQRLAEPDDPQRWESVRARLLAAREQRVWPARDDKVVAAWNGLAVAGLAEAGVLLQRPEWVAAAARTGELLWSLHWTGDRLRRTSRDGRPGRNAGVLDDYGDVAEGFLALLAATGDGHWLTRAGALLEVVLDRFGDGAGAFYDTADDAERLVRRPQDLTDGPVPAGNAAAAGALLTYAAVTGSARHREAADGVLARCAPLVGRHARFVGWAAAVGEAALAGPLEVAVVGRGAGAEELHRVAVAAAGRAAVVRGDGESGQDVPLLAGRPAAEGRPLAYVCRQFTCSAPVTTAEDLTAALRAG
jgi:uncharacterized protein